MKVALVADTLSLKKGTGIARYSQELFRGLTNWGLEIEAICPQPPNVPFGLAINHALRMPYAVCSKAAGFDVIHAISPITALVFPVLRKPKVVTYHDLVSLGGRRTGTALHTRLFAPFFLTIGKYANKIIANSSVTKEDIVARLGIPEGKVSVVAWGVSQAFEPRRRTNRQGKVIGYVGALNRRKGLPYLIRAFRILRANHPELEAELSICGPKAQEYARLLKLTEKNDLGQVTQFKGYIPENELAEAYNSFDVFVLPSEWEGFGLPILEAQRCGVPVIIREDAHIPPEVAQCCLKAASEEDMAEKLHELLTSRLLRQAIAEEGLEYSKQFTWERTVEQTLAVYQQVLA